MTTAFLSPRHAFARVRRADGRLLFIGFFLFASLVFPLIMGPYAHYSVDEGIYHLMARSFWQDGSLHVWNGYREFPAPELVLWFLRVHDGMLAPQYPSFYAVIAAPFYGVAGFAGLVLLNGLAYAGAAWLCFAAALRLFDDRELAITSCLIYVLASFGWEYSQGAWPHALSSLFVSGCFYLAVIALRATTRRAAIWAALGSGLVAGFGAGVRLDAILVVPAAIVPLLFVKPWRPAAAVCVVLGLAPGLGFMAYANAVKFGVASPFSYGPSSVGQATDPLTYLPLAALGALGMGLLWAYTRMPRRALTVRSRGGMAALLLVAVGALAALWFAWPRVAGFADGVYQLVVDLRVRRLSIVEPGLTRGPGGGMIYLGALKTSLLQSLPYLAALILPLAALIRRRDEALRLAMLFLVPAAFIGFFSLKAWHGGLSLNLRYFVPILPFTSILTAWALRDLTRFQPLPGRWSFVSPPRLMILWLLLLLWAGMGVVDQRHEFVVLNTPLVIAALLAVLSFLWVSPVASGGARERVRVLTAAMLFAALAWGGALYYSYDATRAIKARRDRAALAADVVRAVSEDSLVLVDFPDSMYGVLSKRRVRLGMLNPRNLARSKPLIVHHLNAGRPVYLWIETGDLGLLPKNGFAGLRVEPIRESPLGVLSRISLAKGGDS